VAEANGTDFNGKLRDEKTILERPVMCPECNSPAAILRGGAVAGSRDICR
jgi:hypothetical protein